MRTVIRFTALVAGLLASQLCVAQAPAGATGLCDEGTYYTGATKQGHSSITITQRYVHPQADAVERAFTAFGNLGTAEELKPSEWVQF